MQSLILLTLLPAVSVLAADVSATGIIEGLDGGLEGVITVKSEDTIEISGYTLEDASAPALYWWGATSEDLATGFRISTMEVTETTEDATVEIALNNGYSAGDFDFVGLWCETFELNFGQAALAVEGGGSTSDDEPTTGDDEPAPGDDEAEKEEDDDATTPDSGAGKMASTAFGALAAAGVVAALMA